MTKARLGRALSSMNKRKMESTLAYHSINQEKEIFIMDEKNVPSESVTNVFKNGRMPTKEEYTKIWIEMINHIERLNANQDE